MDGKFTWKTSVIPVQIIVEVFACTDMVEVCTITIKSVAVAPILLMTAVGWNRKNNAHLQMEMQMQYNLCDGLLLRN